MSPNGKIVSLGSGGPWPGVGPFIFSMHHLDRYPAAEGDTMGPSKADFKTREMGSDFGHASGWSMYHGDDVPGFPHHPHRGFETISLTRQGYIDHADSTGAGARYGPGDVQWVTAGRGVSHSEMFPLIHKDKDNTMELYQLWLNLPASGKKAPPEFKMLWREQVPVVKRENARGEARVTVVAGAFDGVVPPAPPTASWASNPDADVAVWLIDMEPFSSLKLPAVNTDKTKRMLYVHSDNPGDAKVNVGGIWVSDGEGFEPEMGDRTRLTLTNGPKQSRILVLQAVEIGEPVARQGPFVMNTNDELRQAYADYQRDQFGGWPWPEAGPVYGRDKPRFAKHGDGKEEYPAGKAPLTATA